MTSAAPTVPRTAAIGLVQRMARRKFMRDDTSMTPPLQNARQAPLRMIDGCLRPAIGFGDDDRFSAPPAGAPIRHRAGSPAAVRLPAARNGRISRRQERAFLQVGIDREDHRTHRRGRRDLVAAHAGFGEMLERAGRRPFDEIAHHGDVVLRGMHPMDGVLAPRRIESVADDHEHRHAVAEGVVNRHRRVLQPTVRGRRRGEACSLSGVAMRDGDRGFLMRRGQEFRRSNVLP